MHAFSVLKVSASAGVVCCVSCISLSLSLSLGAASQILEKHEEEFIEVVDAKLNLLRLKRKKVITESLVTKIESADSANARELLYDHLYRNADVGALREYCKMAIAADAIPKMQKLGEKMLSELPPEGVLEWRHCVCTLHMCILCLLLLATMFHIGKHNTPY